MPARDFEQYLTGLGRLYREALGASVEAGLLRRMGGTLALAARDAAAVRVQQDALLGVIDMRRSAAEIDTVARVRWQQHRARIMAAVEGGLSPKAAVRQFFQDQAGCLPHTPRQVQMLLQRHAGAHGTHSAWLAPIVEFRARYRRAAGVMTGSSFTAIVAGMHFLATAEDWEHGTPEEWDRSLAAGEMAAPLAGLAQGMAGVAQARTAPHPDTSGRTEAAIAAPAQRTQAGTRATEAGARGTGSAARGTGSAARGTAGSGTGAAPAAAPRAPARARDDHPGLDEAFSGQGGRFERSPLRGVDSQGRQLVDRGTRTGPRQDRLDFASPRQRSRPSASIPALSTLGLTERQIQVAARLIGQRLNRRFLRLWNSAIDARARRDMATVRTLERSSNAQDQARARVLSRQVYDRVRGKFWRLVRANHMLERLLTGIGLQWPANPEGVPFLAMGSRREQLTLEHSSRVTDRPSAAIDGRHLLFSLRRENSGMLEGVRTSGWDRAQQEAQATAPP